MLVFVFTASSSWRRLRLHLRCQFCFYLLALLWRCFGSQRAKTVEIAIGSAQYLADGYVAGSHSIQPASLLHYTLTRLKRLKAALYLYR